MSREKLATKIEEKIREKAPAIHGSYVDKVTVPAVMEAIDEYVSSFEGDEDSRELQVGDWVEYVDTSGKRDRVGKGDKGTIASIQEGDELHVSWDHLAGRGHTGHGGVCPDRSCWVVLSHEVERINED